LVSGYRLGFSWQMAALIEEPLVGRADELDAVERLLDDLEGGTPGSVEVAGEPGIGKTRLLRELTARADDRGHLVLTGSASELEGDLPFSVFVDALDEYLRALSPELFTTMDEHVQAELAHVFPSLWALSDDREVSLQHERYRSHRAVRELLERLAEPRPLVLVLDDAQWADPASVELMGALLRRRPTAPVLMALGVRPHQAPERLSAATERAHREQLLIKIELEALSPDDASAFLGRRVDSADVSSLYDESGGNPFYLQQLARMLDRTTAVGPDAAELSETIGVPPPVAAALAHELALLSKPARMVLEGAAVAGDPFEPELASAAAEASDAATMDAIDELLQRDLIRQTEIPRRFRFRHPLVRGAVYESTAAGWRLGAHERCADALAARGATTVARAHHVERSARRGDLGAVAILSEAGETSARLAPGSAARWFGAALRLLPRTAPTNDHVELLLARARALAGAGHFADSHRALLEAIEIVPEPSSVVHATLATSCARVERFLGEYEPAHERLVKTLRGLPDPASADSVGLLIELTLNEFYRSRFDAMHDWAEQAVEAARELDDPALLAAAMAMPALAGAMTGPTEAALSRRAAAARLVDELRDEELSLRPDAAAWLAAAELYLDLFAEADAHAGRALALARTTGRGDPFGLYQILPRVWSIRGKLGEAAELLDGAIEAVSLLGTPPALAGNLFNRSVVALAVGDLDLALATAREAEACTRDLVAGFVTAWAAVRLAGVLLEAGQPEQAVDLLLERAGGEGLTLIPGGWRTYCLELLTRSWLALDRSPEAERAAALARATATAIRLPLTTAWADRAAAAVALHAGDNARAVERALASADAADGAGAPIEAGLSRTLAGRALAGAGESERAVAELQRAATAFDTCGALRYRDSAERELGRLGHRPHRRTRAGAADGRGIASLTERELQVARLVVDRKTNPEIAAELFLSQKTVETHLRNIFHKMNVTSRTALARVVEREEKFATARPT
jgi:ATP/maltotriose-dependent transcriptional regulator MalT